MDEQHVADSETNQSQPNIIESKPGGPPGGASGSGEGADKRDSISASPTIGGGIAGRDTEGNSTVGDDQE